MNKMRYKIKQQGGLLIRDNTYMIPKQHLESLIYYYKNNKTEYNNIVFRILRELDYKINMIIGIGNKYATEGGMPTSKGIYEPYDWILGNYDVTLNLCYDGKSDPYIINPLSLCINLNDQQELDMLDSTLNGRFTKIIFDKATTNFLSQVNPVLLLTKLYNLLTPDGFLYVDMFIFDKNIMIILDDKLYLTLVKYIDEIIEYIEDKDTFIRNKIRWLEEDLYKGNPFIYRFRIFIKHIDTQYHDKIKRLPESEDSDDLVNLIKEINVNILKSVPYFKHCIHRKSNEAQYPLNPRDSSNTKEHFVISK